MLAPAHAHTRTFDLSLSENQFPPFPIKVGGCKSAGGSLLFRPAAPPDMMNGAATPARPPLRDFLSFFWFSPGGVLEKRESTGEKTKRRSNQLLPRRAAILEVLDRPTARTNVAAGAASA